jgi:hypothetical protein
MPGLPFVTNLEIDDKTVRYIILMKGKIFGRGVVWGGPSFHLSIAGVKKTDQATRDKFLRCS